MQKKLFVTTLLAAGLFISGCNHTTASLNPAVSVDKTFKTAISKEKIKSAVVSAAEKSQWKIISDENGDMIELRKSYKKRRPLASHPAFRGRKKVISEYVFAQVDIRKGGFEIRLSDSSKQELSHVDKAVNQDTRALEKAIYSELLPHAL